MPNPNYVKGRRKEYKLCRELREEGYDIVQRTAGSHSPIDLFAIDRITKEILFVQAKPDNFNMSHIMEEMNWLNGEFKVKFIVR